MPSTGRFFSNTHVGVSGAPVSYTLAGPPDRMTPRGFSFSIVSHGVSGGTSSQYTWHSRTRRAISIENCEPKSMTTTASGCTGTGGGVSDGDSPLFSRAISRYVETSTSPEVRTLRELCASAMPYPVCAGEVP